MILDMNLFDFGKEEIRAIRELLFDEFLQAPPLTDTLTIYNDIVNQRQVGFVGEGSLVGVRNQGCNSQPTDYEISTRMVEWNPQAWEILLQQCWTDLESTAALYSLKTGVNVSDFTETDYMALILDSLSKSVQSFAFRMAWFADTAAEHTDNSGVIASGIDLEYFTLIDGLWRQIFEELAARPDGLVTIDANSGGSYDDQRELDPAEVRDVILPELVDRADTAALGENPIIFATASVWNAYKRSLQGIQLDTMLRNLQNGIQVLEFDGYEVHKVPMWDKMIREYETNGTTWHLPHRAIFAPREILAFGVDAVDSFELKRVWYEKVERRVYIELMGRLDAKLLNPGIITAAY